MGGGINCSLVIYLEIKALVLTLGLYLALFIMLRLDILLSFSSAAFFFISDFIWDPKFSFVLVCVNVCLNSSCSSSSNSATEAFIGIGIFILKYSNCNHSEAVGLLLGLYSSIAVISSIAESLAFCTIELKLCGMH